MMVKIGIKKTLNIHKFSVRVNDIISEWKLVVPIIFAVVGLFIGSALAKGEGEFYEISSDLIEKIFIENNNSTLYSDIIFYLLFPSVFAVLLFFCGMSVYGGMVSNGITLIYGLIIGIITYYFYSNFSLKGLAYCVIIIFPYAVLTLFSLILITCECINMSQVLAKSLSKNLRGSEYNFKFYYINCLKSYCFIIFGTTVKILIDSLFISLFNF